MLRQSTSTWRTTISSACTKALRSTPAMALGIADRVWTIGDLLDAALAVAPSTPTEPTPQDRRKGFRVIEGGKG